MSALGQAFAASFMAAEDRKEDRKEVAAEKKELTRQEQAQKGNVLMAATSAAYG